MERVEFALEGANEVDLLVFVGGAEVRLVENFEADGAARIAEAGRGDHDAHFGDAVRGDRNLAATATKLVGDALFFELVGDLGAVFEGEALVGDDHVRRGGGDEDEVEDDDRAGDDAAEGDLPGTGKRVPPVHDLSERRVVPHPCLRGDSE